MWPDYTVTVGSTPHRPWFDVNLKANRVLTPAEIKQFLLFFSTCKKRSWDISVTDCKIFFTIYNFLQFSCITCKTGHVKYVTVYQILCVKRTVLREWEGYMTFDFLCTYSFSRTMFLYDVAKMLNLCFCMFLML